MAGYVNIVLGDGVSYFRYAYVNGSGTRVPASGYTIARGNVNVYCDHLWVDSLGINGSYTYPWLASYTNTSRFASGTGYKYSGYDDSVSVNVYPTSSATSSSPARITYSATEDVTEYTYYYRVNLYLDGSLEDYYFDYATTTASTGYNISLSSARSNFSIGSDWVFDSASGGNRCTYANGYFTVTSTSNSSRSVCNIYYTTPPKGWAKLSIGSGIASVQYAYVNANGNRIPSTGYNTTTSNLLVQCDHLYIYSVTYADGYVAPWNASYNSSSYFASASYKPTSGDGTVSANIYPSSSTSSAYPATITLSGTIITYTYYYRIQLYVDGVRQDYYDGTAVAYADTGTSISIASARSHFSISSTWEAADPPATAGNACTYAQGYFTITSMNSGSRSVCNLWYNTKTYTYYYRVNLYVNGTLQDYVNKSTTTTVSTGINVSLSTAQGYFDIQDNWAFSYAEAGDNCAYDRGYFTITSTSSSSRSICNLYYTITSYTYYYRVQWYVDGVRQSYHDDSATVTSSNGTNISLATAQSYFSIDTNRYTFSEATAGNACTYSRGYFTVTSTNSSSKSVCNIWYTTNTYTVGASTTPAYSAMFKALYVNGTTGVKTVTYGGSAVLSYEMNYGYDFDGWYSDSGLTNRVGTGATYTVSNVTANTFIYAKAKKKTYTCAASSSGYGCCFSSVSVSKTTAEYNESVTFTANVKTGYVFRGWYNASGTRVSTSTSYSQNITENTTLYARASVEWTYGNKDSSSGLTLKFSGGYQISAEEWTRLQTYINQRRSSNYSYGYTANTGEYLLADLYNDTRKAIGTGSTVTKGQRVSAALLNALITNANNL